MPVFGDDEELSYFLSGNRMKTISSGHSSSLMGKSTFSCLFIAGGSILLFRFGNFNSLAKYFRRVWNQLLLCFGGVGSATSLCCLRLRRICKERNIH